MLDAEFYILWARDLMPCFAVLFAIFTKVRHVFTMFCRDFLLSLKMNTIYSAGWRFLKWSVSGYQCSFTVAFMACLGLRQSIRLSLFATTSWSVACLCLMLVTPHLLAVISSLPSSFTVPLLLLHRLSGTACRRRWSHPLKPRPWFWDHITDVLLIKIE